MTWKKHGLIYAPSGQLWWARSYAAIPTADVLEDRIRVYFAGLDESQFGRIGYVDLDIDRPERILDESAEPVLDLGPLGAFDDSGVNASCVVRVEGRKYLYYIGWQRCERVPYTLFTGLAMSEDGVTFKRVSAAPILDRNDREPFLRSAPSIIFANNRFRAWYVSALEWTTVKGTQYPTYVIRHSESEDGIHWSSENRVCIDFESPDEFGFGRPWVIQDRDCYRMWYSIRSRTSPYRIGYAESTDGIRWTRLDGLAGIERSSEGWDSEMICYSCVVDAKDRRYMFYNGNRHGSSGFGYATLER